MIKTYTFVVGDDNKVAFAGGNIDPAEAAQILQAIAIQYAVRRQLNERDRGTNTPDEGEQDDRAGGESNPEHTGRDRKNEEGT